MSPGDNMNNTITFKYYFPISGKLRYIYNKLSNSTWDFFQIEAKTHDIQDIKKVKIYYEKPVNVILKEVKQLI